MVRVFGINSYARFCLKRELREVSWYEYIATELDGRVAVGNQGGATATPASVTPIADQIGAGMAASTPEQWQASATASITGMVQTESLRAGPIEHSVTSDPGVAGRAMRELIVTDLRPELSAITAPTEVIYVAFNNPGMTPEMTDGIYAASFANLEGVVLTRIDDSAHFIMLDQPDRLADQINDFLD